MRKLISNDTVRLAGVVALVAGTVAGCSSPTTSAEAPAGSEPNASITALQDDDAGGARTPPARDPSTTRTADGGGGSMTPVADTTPTTPTTTSPVRTPTASGRSSTPRTVDPDEAAGSDPATLARVRESAALLDEYFKTLKPGEDAPDGENPSGAGTPEVRVSRSGGYDPGAVRGPTRVVDPATGKVVVSDPAPTADITAPRADPKPTTTTTPGGDGAPTGVADGTTGETDTGGTLASGPSLVGKSLSPEERKSALVEELVGLLRELGKSPDQRYQAALALAGLEVLSPDAMYDLVDDGVMLPNETAVLVGAHKLFSALAAGGEIADPGRAMDVLDEVSDELTTYAPIKITAAELCTRVSGFGQYDTFGQDADGGYTFIAGRRQPVIIYVEVDRFGRKPTVGADGVARWEVALSQELEIYHEGDELMVMSRQPETDRTLTRSRMRDYYLINQTYLPETLGVGRYTLKVIMRDENKDAVAEALIPIRIVSNRATVSVPTTTE